MAPPKHQPPDPYEQEYAIRDLVKAVELLKEQAEESEKRIESLEKGALEWKTKWAMLTALWTIAVAIAMKFLPLHL